MTPAECRAAMERLLPQIRAWLQLLPSPELREARDCSQCGAERSTGGQLQHTDECVVPLLEDVADLLSALSVEEARTTPARCPNGHPLQKVTRPSNSMLNDDQFDAVRAGDWFCETCPPNGRSWTKACYFWDRELAPQPLAGEETPPLCRCGVVATGTALYMGRVVAVCPVHAQVADPPASSEGALTIDQITQALANLRCDGCHVSPTVTPERSEQESCWRCEPTRLLLQRLREAAKENTR